MSERGDMIMLLSRDPGSVRLMVQWLEEIEARVATLETRIARLTEDGDERVTEDGEMRAVEP